MKFKISCIVIICLSLFSCLKLEDEDNDTPEPICTFDSGAPKVSTISTESFPYKDIKNIIFKDSFGITKLFEVTSSNSASKVVNTTNFFNVLTNKNETVTNCMDANVITYTLKELGGQLILKALIYNDFDQASPKKDIIDKIEIAISEKGDENITFPIFNMIVDKRNSQDGFTELLKTMDEVTIYGKKFNSVFQNIPLPNTIVTYWVYYNKNEGIVGFSESNGRKWRFDSMN